MIIKGVKLTPRELDVMTLIVQGYRAKMAAHELGVSRRTIETHIIHVREKLGVRTTIQAIVLYVEERTRNEVMKELEREPK